MVGAQCTFSRVVVRLQATATVSSHTPICQEQCGIQGLVQSAEFHRQVVGESEGEVTTRLEWERGRQAVLPS